VPAEGGEKKAASACLGALRPEARSRGKRGSRDIFSPFREKGDGRPPRKVGEKKGNVNQEDLSPENLFEDPLRGLFLFGESGPSKEKNRPALQEKKMGGHHRSLGLGSDFLFDSKGRSSRLKIPHLGNERVY